MHAVITPAHPSATSKGIALWLFSNSFAPEPDPSPCLQEYRDNRKFSLQVRDLVALGQAEEAQALCDAQADAMLSKLNLDTALRSEYCQLWADQRRNVVSDLLPESSTSAAAAAAAAPKGAKRGKDKDGKDVAPVKLVARGAEKAKDLIASIMAKASSEAAHRRSMTPAHHHDIEDLEEEVCAWLKRRHAFVLLEQGRSLDHPFVLLRRPGTSDFGSMAMISPTPAPCCLR